jgi:ubiquinone/menaquinone biosynthesis C-methylase UbiE
MSVRKDTIFERFLSPIFQTFLIDRDALAAESHQIQWQSECDRLQNPTVEYPAYYQQQNFHGIEGGYLTSSAAMSYDPITQYVLPPNEEWVRRGLIERIQGHPRRILDLGCGTGSMTVMLKQAFPNAEVIGLDLSPHMLIMAERKAVKQGLEIQFRHAKAEQTGFPPASFDLVTAALLFHETPVAIASLILQECFRLLTPGGEMLVLDGNQATLRQTDWLTDVFEEPYIRDYAAGSVDAWMGRAGFEQVRTHSHWWMHQVTCGLKPLPVQAPMPTTAQTAGDADLPWALA